MRLCIRWCAYAQVYTARPRKPIAPMGGMSETHLTSTPSMWNSFFSVTVRHLFGHAGNATIHIQSMDYPPPHFAFTCMWSGLALVAPCVCMRPTLACVRFVFLSLQFNCRVTLTNDEYILFTLRSMHVDASLLAQFSAALVPPCRPPNPGTFCICFRSFRASAATSLSLVSHFSLRFFVGRALGVLSMLSHY